MALIRGLKTIAGEWRTPTPIVIKADNDEASQVEGKVAFITERGHFKIVVERKTISINGRDKIQRHLTLTEASTGFTCEGKANVKVDRITWSDGSVWARPGATSKDRERMKREGKFTQDVQLHGAAAPDDAAGRAAFCGFFCRAKPSGGNALGQAPAEVGPDGEPVPEQKGFLTDEQVDDVVDRINEVVGIWGVSEATEREFIKPPVVMMNTLIKGCLDVIMDNALVDLIQFLLDGAAEAAEKASRLMAYINEKFIQPLCALLMEKLADSFKAFDWIKDHAEKMVNMMSLMVCDEVLSKTVEQLQDNDAIG